MTIKRINFYLFIYLAILFIIGSFHLYFKHTGGADSTISEWLINYQGSFIKRGLIGEICFVIARELNLSLRYVIYIFQLLLIFIYFTLIFLFFKKIKLNYFLSLAIFSPIFLLYPFAELEVLARKEIFIFVGFIFFLFLSSQKYQNKEDIFFIIFALPLLVLIWEPLVFYLPFFIITLILKYSIKNFYEFFKLLIFFTPTILLSLYIAFNPITPDAHLKMANSLKENFGESCYMSCGLLLSKSSIKDQFTANFPLYNPIIFIRYFLIFVIGFGPLLLLSKKSIFLKNVIFLRKFKNLFMPLLIIISPIIILFLMGSDWGRWINITYTFCILFFINLYNNNYINVDFLPFEKFKSKLNNIILVLFFVTFCFGWNPKTSLTGDVASIPGYRVPYNFIKLILNNYN
tara:strand:- start:610 stop:1818 length:1209 start_codon:yes stop_codon:yes gene_type:complete